MSYQKCQDYCHCLPLPCQISAVDIGHCDELPEVSGPGMSLEAGNRRKSPVTLAVTAGYFFSLKKIMRENLSSISNTTYSACIY